MKLHIGQLVRVHNDINETFIAEVLSLGHISKNNALITPPPYSKGWPIEWELNAYSNISSKVVQYETKVWEVCTEDLIPLSVLKKVKDV